MTGLELIALERQRQINVEVWTPEHDAGHDDEAIAKAAAVYATPAADRRMTSGQEPELWPWEPEWYKPTPDDRIRELAKAGALIAAEIDRLQAGSIEASFA